MANEHRPAVATMVPPLPGQGIDKPGFCLQHDRPAPGLQRFRIGTPATHKGVERYVVAASRAAAEAYYRAAKMLHPEELLSVVELPD